MNNYTLYGLNLASEILLPEVPKAEGSPDFTIEIADVKEPLNPLTQTALYRAGKNWFFLTVPNIVNILVTDGNKILVAPCPKADIQDVVTFILGPAILALLQQRGYFVLHANAVVNDDKLIVFSGRSGAGKSTLSAGFFKRGFKIFADDICIISQEIDGFFVQPGFTRLKLWADVLSELGEDIDMLHPVRAGLQKYNFETSTEFFNSKMRIRSIYFLSTHNKNEVELESINGIEKFNMVRLQGGLVRVQEACYSGEESFKFIMKLASNIEVKKLVRPQHRFSLNELVDIIEKDMKFV